MEQIMNYVKPELIIVAIVLYFLGMGLKQARKDACYFYAFLGRKCDESN